MAKKKTDTDEEIEVEAEAETPVIVEVTDSAVHVPVRILRRQGESTVVQYLEDEDEYRAVVVPQKAVRESVSAPGEPYVLGSDLLEGVAYGLDWEAIIKPQPHLARRIGQQLRKAGIWTAEDARRNPNAVVGALQSAYGLDLGSILSATDPVLVHLQEE